MKKPILITGFVPGYPNTHTSLKIAKTLHHAGADILELSASFSEPIADGKTLQIAHARVLARGFTKADAFRLYKKIKHETQAPLFLIEYANIIYQHGIDRYYKKAASAGITYLGIPDVSLEESEPFVKAAKKHGLAHIFFIAPTTPNARIKKIATAAKHTPATNVPLPTFLYLVSITGITGSRKTVKAETIQFIKRVRKLTELPLIVGFGISSKAHIKKVVAAGADGVVTCSPIVDMVHTEKQPTRLLKSIQAYVTNLL